MSTNTPEFGTGLGQINLDMMFVPVKSEKATNLSICHVCSATVPNEPLIQQNHCLWHLELDKKIA
jgi:hypothetical protein